MMGNPAGGVDWYGSPGGIRTPGRLLRRELLFPLSYRAAAKRGEEDGKPDSVPARRRVAAIYLGPPLPAGSSDQPGDWPGAVTSPY